MAADTSAIGAWAEGRGISQILRSIKDREVLVVLLLLAGDVLRDVAVIMDLLAVGVMKDVAVIVDLLVGVLEDVIKDRLWGRFWFWWPVICGAIPAKLLEGLLK